MAAPSKADLPTYYDLIRPTLQAVETLGGSALAREITAQVLVDIGASDEQVALTYEHRPKSILIDRIDWARSYATLGGALERPKRGLFVLTAFGRQILVLPADDAMELVRKLDQTVRSRPRRQRPASVPTKEPSEEEAEAAEAVDEVEPSGQEWRETLLRRLHRLSPDGFEEFVIYLLRTFGMELERVGGSGDEGIDGIGLAPISPVLSSRIAVQAKRHDPASSIGREVVALFQRDADAAGAERAVLVTLGRFSAAARRAATVAKPTVNLVDGDLLCDLVQQQGVGVRSVTVVDELWFDRFS